MRNWKFLMNLAILCTAVIWFSSCEGEEETPQGPIIGNIDVNPADNADGEEDFMILINPGDDVTFTVDVTAAGGFNVARLTYDADPSLNVEQTRNDLGVTAGTVTVNDIVLTLENVTESGTATIQVVDDAGQQVSESYTISLIETATFTTVLLYAPLESEDSESFFSTNLGRSVTKNEVDSNDDGTAMSSDIDFGYAYGTNSGINIASPSAYPEFVNYELNTWNTLNETSFKKVSIDNETYIGADSSDELQDIYNDGTDSPAMSKANIAVGDILAFQLDPDKGSKYGILKVISLVDSNNDGDYIDQNDYIEIEVTVEM